MLLRGRCRSCGAWIPVRYPLVEATTAALFLLCYFQFGLTLGGVGSAVLCWTLLGLAVTDSETFLLPDALTLPGIALGSVYSGLQNAAGPSGVDFSASNHSSSFDLSFGFSWKPAAESLLWAGCAAAPADPADSRTLLAGAPARRHWAGRRQAAGDDCRVARSVANRAGAFPGCHLCRGLWPGADCVGPIAAFDGKEAHGANPARSFLMCRGNILRL